MRVRVGLARRRAVGALQRPLAEQKRGPRRLRRAQEEDAGESDQHLLMESLPFDSITPIQNGGAGQGRGEDSNYKPLDVRLFIRCPGCRGTRDRKLPTSEFGLESFRKFPKLSIGKFPFLEKVSMLYITLNCHIQYVYIGHESRVTSTSKAVPYINIDIPDDEQ